MELLANLIATVINVTLVAFGVRRLLGVPVGWPRTLLVSLSFSSFASWLFPLLEGFLGLNLDPGSPTLIPGILLFTLVFAWLLAAQVGLLAAFEAFVPTGSVPGPVAFLRSLPARRRRSVRYTKIVAIAASHGLSTYLRPRSSRTGRPASKVARSLRDALTDGGVLRQARADARLSTGPAAAALHRGTGAAADQCAGAAVVRCEERLRR